MRFTVFIFVRLLEYRANIALEPEDIDIGFNKEYKATQKEVSFFGGRIYASLGIFIKKKSSLNAEMSIAEMSRNGNAEMSADDIPF